MENQREYSNNNYSHIRVGTNYLDDCLEAEFSPAPGDNLRTKVGLRRLQRFINILQQLHDTYCAIYQPNGTEK